MTSVPGIDPAKLVSAYREYAHSIAGDLLRRLPSSIERSDVLAWADLGLVEAANRFDPAKGAQFKTFAYYRVRGAVYDGLRKTGWFSKQEYQRYRFESQANEYMKDVSEGPPASPDDRRQRLRRTAGNVLTCYMLSLDDPEGAAEPPASADPSPESVVASREMRQRLRECLKDLPEKNRKLLEGYYFCGLTLEEIGRSLDVSKSWASRMHARSLELLRQLLHDSATSGKLLTPAAR